ncbi:hypothetical protein HN371_26130 [Candidatus Poribacteria bacterium]|jgi:hypothetical protein|nr:hypothetical protein [Candidatus Poribacteria bacterium]MBT5713247.1 hypothetical protein [Candidatus Poribacteria bacterium]MBT7096166.1 hypothetical protein [Candidatus Poribacteria bacterium]MBT7805650.1 hypothetical protein [Candidatus Poribacteria bacterium]
MAKWRLPSILIALSVLTISASAQIVFFADFEDNSSAAVPGPEVNEIAAWVPDNAGQIWDIQDHPGTGNKGLFNTIEGCGTSGNTPLPGVTNFSDGVIQLLMSTTDDDSFGVVLRQSSESAGYVITFGTIETPAIIFARLDDGCGATGSCNDQTSCENGGNELLQVDHGLGPIAQDNTQVLLGRIEAVGSSIKVWYVDVANVADPMGDLGAPTLEITDGTHSSGAVGVWHESQQLSFVDDVLVTGPGGLNSTAVDAQGKATTYWATVKTAAR